MRSDPQGPLRPHLESGAQAWGEGGSDPPLEPFYKGGAARREGRGGGGGGEGRGRGEGRGQEGAEASVHRISAGWRERGCGASLAACSHSRGAERRCHGAGPPSTWDPQALGPSPAAAAATAEAPVLSRLPAGELGSQAWGPGARSVPQSLDIRGCGAVHVGRQAQVECTGVLLWGAGARAVQGDFLGDLGQLWSLWCRAGWAVVPCKVGVGALGWGVLPVRPSLGSLM